VAEATGLVRHAVVLVAVVNVSHLPAFLYCGGADDGAESHGERDDDHGEWFHHLGGLSVCVVRAGELSFGDGERLEAAVGNLCLVGWTEIVLVLVLVCIDLRWRYETDSLVALRKD
jgi:hypothetical protein